MTPRDWLLLFFALKGSPAGLDPVRIQKGMFLFAMESGVPEDERYHFTPYSYGPMSPQVYADVDYLEATGLLLGEAVPGYTWKRYKVTPPGMDVARDLLADADSDVLQKLYEIKLDITDKTFNQLLRDVYARYPQYATRSVFSG